MLTPVVLVERIPRALFARGMRFWFVVFFHILFVKLSHLERKIEILSFSARVSTNL